MFKTHEQTYSGDRSFKYKFGLPECVKGVPVMHPKWKVIPISFIPPFRESKFSDWFSFYRICWCIISGIQNSHCWHFFWPFEQKIAQVLENTSHTYVHTQIINQCCSEFLNVKNNYNWSALLHGCWFVSLSVCGCQVKTTYACLCLHVWVFDYLLQLHTFWSVVTLTLTAFTPEKHPITTAEWGQNILLCCTAWTFALSLVSVSNVTLGWLVRQTDKNAKYLFHKQS